LFKSGCTTFRRICGDVVLQANHSDGIKKSRKSRPQLGNGEDKVVLTNAHLVAGSDGTYISV